MGVCIGVMADASIEIINSEMGLVAHRMAQRWALVLLGNEN